MTSNRHFYHQNKGDVVWWVETPETDGEFLFSFDKKTIFNFFRDYPKKLTAEQKRIFDRENPELIRLKG